MNRKDMMPKPGWISNLGISAGTCVQDLTPVTWSIASLTRGKCLA